MGLKFSLFLLLVLLVAPAWAVDSEGGVAGKSQEELILDATVRFWLSINEARRDPLATIERLELDAVEVRAVFGEDQWLLDQGLPPLAWNGQLVGSARDHGRDMLDRSYYSYNTPEGLTSAERIASSGYLATQSGETINALHLENYISLDQAVDSLVDAILVDELTGSSSARGDVFSVDMTEVGISLFAETLFYGGSYVPVYLVVADFAAPAPGSRASVHSPV
ncbi:MAG: hypothetical protein C0614_08295, partial [Desulfuromonas sp.]